MENTDAYLADAHQGLIIYGPAPDNKKMHRRHRKARAQHLAPEQFYGVLEGKVNDTPEFVGKPPVQAGMWRWFIVCLLLGTLIGATYSVTKSISKSHSTPAASIMEEMSYTSTGQTTMTTPSPTPTKKGPRTTSFYDNFYNNYEKPTRYWYPEVTRTTSYRTSTAVAVRCQRYADDKYPACFEPMVKLHRSSSDYEYKPQHRVKILVLKATVLGVGVGVGVGIVSFLAYNCMYGL